LAWKRESSDKNARIFWTEGVCVLKIWAAVLLLALIATGVAIAVIGLCVTVFVKKDRNG
jgi:uncharacterized iron-regulated membrane protein